MTIPRLQAVLNPLKISPMVNHFGTLPRSRQFSRAWHLMLSTFFAVVDMAVACELVTIVTHMPIRVRVM